MRKLVYAVICGILMATVAGCAKPVVKGGPVFFPPPPDPPRVQFLTVLNSSYDLVPKKDTFLLVVTGKEDEEREIVIKKPYGVTTHKGRIYVSDLSGKVVVIDPDHGIFEAMKGSGLGRIKKPINTGFDSDDNMYVVDATLKKVLVYTPKGEFLREFAAGLAKPTDVIIDGEDVCILDMGDSQIKIFDRKSGELKNSIGKANETEESLAAPTNFALDSKGAFYVTNVVGTNVVKMDKDGHLLRAIGKLGKVYGEFQRPKGIAVDDQNRLYVVDAGHQNVQMFNEDARLLLYFGDPGMERGSLNLPAGIAVSKATVPFFSKFADPSFELESVIFITNQFGDARLSVYGLGHRKGEVPIPDKAPEKEVKPAKATGDGAGKAVEEGAKPGDKQETGAGTRVDEKDKAGSPKP